MSNNRKFIHGCNCHLPLTHVEKLRIKKDNEYYRASICFVGLPNNINIGLAEDCLHPEEFTYFDAVKHEKRKRSYLVGRYSAKQALIALVGEDDPKKILIRPGIFGQPVIKYENKQDIQISITHCDNIGASIAFLEELPMGIDIERINPAKTTVLESKLTNEEKEKVRLVSCSYDLMLAVMWTVKEALSKILRTGLTTQFTLFEVSSIEVRGNLITSYFRHFGQYKSVSFDLGNYICSIVYPKNTEFDFDLNALKHNVHSALMEAYSGR